MQSFLYRVVSEVLESDTDLSSATFVLPNKRAGLFLKNALKNQLKQNTLLPRILSIEEFVKEISGMEALDNINLIFEFYSIYVQYTRKDATDSFESFSKWAAILLQDFNDLDSNLLDSTAILDYLSDVKRIENWQLQHEDESHLVKKHLEFFNKSIKYYEAFKTHLLKNGVGYQGLIYRMAAEKIETINKNQLKGMYIFAAFNALNKAEESIIQYLLGKDLARIFWDHDEFYVNTDNQAGQFFKKYIQSWPYYAKNKFRWIKDNLNTPKTIHFHGLPKNISQIKHVGNLLNELQNKDQIKDTAVILGNEKLLPSLLNSLPKKMHRANITMGYELQNVPLTTFFLTLFKLHLNSSARKGGVSFYYRDLITLFNDPLLKAYLGQDKKLSLSIHTILYTDKAIFVSLERLMELVKTSEANNHLFSCIFLGWELGIQHIIDKITRIITFLSESKTENKLIQEYLFRFHNIFVQLNNLNDNFGFINNLNTLYQVFQQILKTEKLFFQGEPLEGLQIMGLLESRGLDFKNVIITSVNEGFLPSTGTNTSFIPLDIKFEKKIPTFFEKDAIFSYHFFRLLHRAENVYLIYNSITDDFGSGEPSRFIRQLKAAKALGQLDEVSFVNKTISPPVNPSPVSLTIIDKTEDIMLDIAALSKKGLSPSSLTNYIRNPLDFYKRSVLGLKEFKEMEETIAANTFGTIVHDTLEQLYAPFLNQNLQIETLKKLLDLVDHEVIHQFGETYTKSAISSGKNYLALEIAKQFVRNFISYEIAYLKRGKQVKILGLEVPISTMHNVKSLDTEIKLKGKIDRVDQVDGVMRIMDYKTGKTIPSQLKITDWSLLCTDEKYMKSFQVLTYAYMFVKNGQASLAEGSLQSGILSFKNLKQGFMPFNNDKITEDTLSSFVQQLDGLILEIFNKDIPFTEKEIPDFNY